MSEISFIRRESDLVDIKIENGDIDMGDDLITSVGISLFTNARRSEDGFDSKDLTSNQGWWGDINRESPLGSLIWTYTRSKVTKATLELVRSTCTEALAWLTKDGVASSVDVLAHWDSDLDGVMILEIAIHKPSGDVESFKYQFAWNLLEGE